jgi:hypothetical protein
MRQSVALKTAVAIAGQCAESILRTPWYAKTFEIRMIAAIQTAKNVLFRRIDST